MGNIASSVRESARTAQVVFRRPKLSALSSADDVLAALHANPSLLHQRRYFQNETIWHRLVQRDQAAAMLRILEAVQQMAQDPDGMDKLVALGIGVTHDMGPQELVSLFLNLRNANGETPLHLACMLGRHRMAELLVKKGADPWCRDEGGGRTPLHFAAMRDQVQCIHALMKAVPPALRVNSAGTRLVDVSSDGGFTSLHYAIAFNLPRAARTLLAYYPDLHKANHASGARHDI
ncbi:ankyrin repeat-containing domain protein [Haematococcus lacustris]